ncbi:MAG: T9SS type A sorting domain-containing protein [Bacteroidota bacterium]|nr:T9SS type A sorting domain-containing protein [Bacteroidota bacterium]
MNLHQYFSQNFLSYVFILLLVFLSLHTVAQDDVKISDNANLIISENTTINIPGDLTLGQGLSGLLSMNGNTLNVTGQLVVNAGSEFEVSAGNFSASTIDLNTESTVTYSGTNQNITNWDYGHLVLNGTGEKSITGDAVTPTTCNFLTINNVGNQLTIPENKALTVQNTLTNNVGTAGISIESSATGDGSLISYTAGVSATVNRYITGQRWHYLSGPIHSAPRSLFNQTNFLWWDAAVEWEGSGDYVPWKDYSATNLVNAQGYAYYYNETTIGFEGDMNVGDYTRTLHKSAAGNSDEQGWNLVGNPYTSVLDWNAAVADGAVPVGAENAVYFFDDNGDGSTSNYRYYVPSTGGTYGIGTENATGEISTGQGFFIKTNTDNVTLNFKKDYRKHSTQEFYKSFNGDFIKLEISNGISDETIVRVVNRSSFRFDGAYDARKLFSTDETIPQLYSIDESNVATAINSIPEIKNSTKIKLGVQASEGSFEINLKELNYYTYDVYLTDKLNGISVNLTQTKTYRFYHSGGENTERFYLSFQEETSGINSDGISSVAVFPNPTKGRINVESFGNAKIQKITISSVGGKIFYTNTNATTVNSVDLSSLSGGVYFIKFELSDGEINQKRIIIQK